LHGLRRLCGIHRSLVAVEAKTPSTVKTNGKECRRGLHEPATNTIGRSGLIVRSLHRRRRYHDDVDVDDDVHVHVHVLVRVRGGGGGGGGGDRCVMSRCWTSAVEVQTRDRRRDGRQSFAARRATRRR